MQFLSIGKITHTGCTILFTLTSYVVQDHMGRNIRTGRKVNVLFQLEYLHLSLPSPAGFGLSTSDFWHHRLGHISISCLKTLSNSGALGTFIFF